MTANEKTFFKKTITSTQKRDAGMAFVLIFIILTFIINEINPLKIPDSSIVLNKLWPLKIAIISLLINMMWPGFFTLFARLWFGLAELLGNISSKILLTIIFFIVVTPIGLLRRILGNDKLKLKLFKKNSTSVLIHRDHTFVKENIEQPF